ncbi:MAG: response regulator [Gammaproteobacteria bacterium]|jgi:hypothetical protein|nr:response regulator [Thiotrichales bacterium]MBT6079614.1 response regulator [Gammaproteobacteria bacterium]MBT7230059.1 response regulator [Gammaproteobacteria bacterium]
MDGIEATKLIRESGNQVPIVACTANVTERHREEFECAGYDGFLSKPFQQQELYNILSEFLTLGHL